MCHIYLLPCQAVEGEGGQWENKRSFPGLESSPHGPRAEPQGHVQTVIVHSHQTILFFFFDEKLLKKLSPNESYLILHRLLKAGKAKVYYCPLPSHASVTHVMAKPISDDSKSHNAPCYPVSHIVQHLFGVRWTVCCLDKIHFACTSNIYNFS